MATYDFAVFDVIPAPPQYVYDAWMSSEGHAAMTGADAEIDETIGGEYTAWDGYIAGRTLSLEPGRRIVQTWRTTEFPEEAADSRIDVLLEPDPGGTRITIHHTGVPDDQLEYELDGWQNSYFEPMKAYFGKL